MNPDSVNVTVNKYISDNLSPKPEQREYIDEKYNELKQILGGNTFRSGSYARFTAIDPVHDLDVIYPVADRSLENDPRPTIQSVLKQLKEGYADSETEVKNISVQTHSVTIELSDAPEGTFSIDVVPAVKIDELNSFGDNYFMVPEILQLNRHNRELRYNSTSDENPIGWIKSDPRGYRKAASTMNDDNPNFRHAVKLLKSWRHACKMQHKDSFRLKSFHLEQIIYSFFTANPSATTLDAVVESLATLPAYLHKPQITDRADPLKFIDEYVSELNVEQRKLIVGLQSQALDVASRISAQSTAHGIITQLEEMLAITPSNSSSSPRLVSPNRPWSI